MIASVRTSMGEGNILILVDKDVNSTHLLLYIDTHTQSFLYIRACAYAMAIYPHV